MAYRIHSASSDYQRDAEQRECARGGRCAEASVIQEPDGSLTKTPALGYRAFCSTDRSYILNCIEQLPEQYVHLALILPEKGSGAEPRVSGSRTPPVPPRVDVDALMADLVQESLAWWERVTDVAGLAAPEGKTRDGFSVGRMCTTLARHVDVLLSLPPERMGRRVTPHQAAELLAVGGVTGVMRPNAGYAEIYQERSGADAGLDFLTLNRRCRHMLGLTPQHQDLPVPCWACGERAVRRWDGAAGLADEAECMRCREKYTHERYRLLMAEVEERQRKKAS